MSRVFGTRHVRFDLTPLNWLVRRLRGQGHGGRLPPPIPKLWGKIYETFVRRRYIRFARGGGDWKPHAPATIAARRKGRGSGSPRILIDRGKVLGALTIGKPGNLFKQIRHGVRFGFGGGAKHPGGPTIAQIAKWHDAGDGRLPQRQIIVPPDAKTIRQMANAVKRSVKSMGKIAQTKLRLSLGSAFRTMRR